MAVYYGRDGRTQYELDKQLKSGGEGIVYTIKGMPDSVAKIYKPERVADPQMRNATRDKILAMLDMNFNPRLNGRIIVAWPEDALFDSAHVFQGFVMPKIQNMKSLIWAMRPSDRDALWANGYRWHYSVAIAYNLALTIEQMHKAGIVVGDMNTNNVLIDAKGNVTLIDADSFNITTKTGQIYKCIVGFPEVLPPELQGKDLAKPTINFTEKTDCFSLAVHVFNIVCNNCHPFGCLNYSQAHGSSSTPKIMDNIVKGYCPYVTGAKGKTVDDALDMDVFPRELRDLFDRAFSYDATTAVKQATISNRPSAQEWRTVLGNLYSAGVTTCKSNKLHEYPKSYTKGCPWCAIEKRKFIANPVAHISTKRSKALGQASRFIMQKNNYLKIVGIGVAIILVLIMVISRISGRDYSSSYSDPQPVFTAEPIQGQWLVDMERIDADRFDDYFNMFYQKNEDQFENVIHGSGYVTFPLNSKYSYLTASWEVKRRDRPDYDFAPAGALKIYSDNVLVYSSPYISCDSNPVDYIYINVQGCNRLKIVFDKYEVQSGFMGMIDTNTGYLNQVWVEP